MMLLPLCFVSLQDEMNLTSCRTNPPHFLYLAFALRAQLGFTWPCQSHKLTSDCEATTYEDSSSKPSRESDTEKLPIFMPESLCQQLHIISGA